MCMSKDTSRKDRIILLMNIGGGGFTLSKVKEILAYAHIIKGTKQRVPSKF